MTTAHLAMRVAEHVWEFRAATSDDDSARSDRRRSSSHAESHTDVDSPRRVDEDNTLLQRLRSGDAQALEALFKAYGRWLLDVANATVGSADLAQDIVQDVFIWLWRTRDRISVRGNIAPYLYRAVRNRALNVHAHERAEHTVRDRLAWERGGSEPGSEPGGIAFQTSEAAAQEFEQTVQHALAELSPKLREVFLLRVDQGWSNAEIAEALGIAVGSVRQQMYRATKLLAERLGPLLDPGE